MRYHVPQFLEVEDKMFGFFTLKQFLYVTGGCALAYIAYTYLVWFLAYPIIAAALALGFSFAFVKINNQPFIVIFEAFLRYTFSPQLYIWKKIPKKIAEKAKGEQPKGLGISVPPLSSNKLKDLSWSLDIQSEGSPEQHQKTNKNSVPLLKDL